MSEHIVHTIEPVFDSESRVLILGTMPSPKSREVGFYYGNSQKSQKPHETVGSVPWNQPIYHSFTTFTRQKDLDMPAQPGAKTAVQDFPYGGFILCAQSIARERGQAIVEYRSERSE